MNPYKAISTLSGGMTAEQKKLLGAIKDPQQKAMQQLQIEESNKSLVATTVSNILKMKHDSEMAPANNLKG